MNVDKWAGKPTPGQIMTINELMKKHPFPDFNLYGKIDQLTMAEASRVIASLKILTIKKKRQRISVSNQDGGLPLTMGQRFEIVCLLERLKLEPKEQDEILKKYSRLGLIDTLLPGEAFKLIQYLRNRLENYQIQAAKEAA